MDFENSNKGTSKLNQCSWGSGQPKLA